MKCNREELEITAGGPLEERWFSAKPRSLPEAWAAQLLPSRNRGPIAEAFSHRASRWDSARERPEIFSSLQPWNRPTSRSVFRRTSRLSQALAESRKSGREWELSVPSPGDLFFSKILTGAMSCPSWMMWIFCVLWKSSAPKPRKHPALPLQVASGPGDSRFELA
jgi:hypothetical protein